MSRPEETIRTMSGVSKRLFMALSDFRADPPQLEDALFQFAAVVDATSKRHYPDERSSRRRFTNYIKAVTTDLCRIATGGALVLLNCTIANRHGEQVSLGDVLYDIRCCSYHDPDEVDQVIRWGDDNVFGTHGGRFTLTKRFLMALFLILISDQVNEDRIDRQLFDDDHYLIIQGVNHPFHRFLGNRDLLMETLGLTPS